MNNMKQIEVQQGLVNIETDNNLSGRISFNKNQGSIVYCQVSQVILATLQTVAIFEGKGHGGSRVPCGQRLEAYF